MSNELIHRDRMTRDPVARRLRRQSPPEPMLLRWLECLEASPTDLVLRAAFADWLDERGPTPVWLHHLPNWLRLAWVRTRRPTDVIPRSSPSSWSVAQEIDRDVSAFNARAGRWCSLDHWGTTILGGVVAFVNEPYAKDPDAQVMFDGLAGRVGAAHGYARGSAWGNGTMRVLLFPPLEMLRDPGRAVRGG